MGLRPLDESRWLEFDEHAESELAQKRALLDDHWDDVVATLPGSEIASGELLESVVGHLAKYFPDRDRRTTREHPVVAASRLAQEDFCVLEKSDTWRLSAACVCFPSRWSLASKLGATLDAIHAPVPLYDQQLASPTNAFFERLSTERSYWRLNWTLLDSPVLHQPSSSRRPPGGDLSDWFFRVERQTLRRLRETDSIVFTIRTYVESAAVLARRDEEFLPALLRALRTAPRAVQDYKGWRGVAERLADA